MLGFGGDVLSVVGRAVIMPPKRSETQFAVSNTEADLPRGYPQLRLAQALATAMATAFCGGKRLHFGGHIQRCQW